MSWDEAAPERERESSMKIIKELDVRKFERFHTSIKPQERKFSEFHVGKSKFSQLSYDDHNASHLFFIFMKGKHVCLKQMLATTPCAINHSLWRVKCTESNNEVHNNKYLHLSRVLKGSQPHGKKAWEAEPNERSQMLNIPRRTF